MKKLCVIVACGIFLFVLTLPALGGGTPEEASALLEKAIAFNKANGNGKALAEFSKPKWKFTKGDLYIFAYNPKGIIIAHGGDPKLMGKDFSMSRTLTENISQGSSLRSALKAAGLTING